MRTILVSRITGCRCFSLTMQRYYILVPIPRFSPTACYTKNGSWGLPDPLFSGCTARAGDGHRPPSSSPCRCGGRRSAVILLVNSPNLKCSVRRISGLKIIGVFIIKKSFLFCWKEIIRNYLGHLGHLGHLKCKSLRVRVCMYARSFRKSLSHLSHLSLEPSGSA